MLSVKLISTNLFKIINNAQSVFYMKIKFYSNLLYKHVGGIFICLYVYLGCNFMSSYAMMQSHIDTCGFRSQQSLPDFSMVSVLYE